MQTIDNDILKPIQKFKNQKFTCCKIGIEMIENDVEIDDYLQT